MIRIGILGGIGSGKSFVAKNFGYPVFNADYEVSKLYQKNRKIYQKLKKILPEYIYKFPIDKIQLTNAIQLLYNNHGLLIHTLKLNVVDGLNIYTLKLIY